uniref:uncharacterized protein LOC122589968 n=1 Tax=Erigeron canadensis TaxID=72917 RepID=UPI001CB994CA|nr:uncharacterized protein LOC122589968 [Erigeron canadensis]XP_043618232.1 uncharacterized protein LOC122589968 [Erigeron canadensis]XP_043618233.1 uncharacterized protein LOC122589968 [Erigeron canadensis]
MSQQSLQTYMPSNTRDDVANIAKKQDEQRIEHHKRKMNLRKRKQPKSRMLGDINRETVIMSAVVPEMHTTRASKKKKRGKTILKRKKLQKTRMLADLYKDTEACGSGQNRFTEASPPCQKEIMAAMQLLEISSGVVPSKTADEYEIDNPICRLNRNPAEFRLSTAQMFMRSV